MAVERGKALRAVGSACEIVLRQEVIQQIFLEHLHCARSRCGHGRQEWATRTFVPTLGVLTCTKGSKMSSDNDRCSVEHKIG